MNSHMWRAGAIAAAFGLVGLSQATAAEVKVLTAGAFKRVVLAAKSVAYIDPASGGSTGIYIDKLLVRLGIADQIRPKANLKKGGHVTDLIVSGEAELGLHQISEIASAQNKDAALALIKALSGPAAAAVLKSKGMEPAG